MSDAVLLQAAAAYRQLTAEEPPNAAEFAARGVFLVMFRDPDSRSVEAAKARMAPRLGDSQHVIDTKFVEQDGQVLGLAVVRGTAGQTWLIEILQTTPKVSIVFVDLLTRDLINQANKDLLMDFEKHLSPSP